MKASKHLIFLRNQAASLAKLKKFDEADKVKMEADACEQTEI